MVRKSARLRGDRVKHLFVIAIVALALFVGFMQVAGAEPVGCYVYISNYNSASISVIDPVTLQKVTDINVGNFPSDIILNPSGTVLYVLYDKGYYVDGYSTTDYSRVCHIKIADMELNLARMSMNSIGTRLYIADASNGRVVQVNIESNTVVNVVTTATAPYGVLWYNNYVYVSDYASPYKLYKLDESSLGIISELSAGLLHRPEDIIVDRANNRLVVLNYDNGTLAGIALSTFTFTELYKSGYTSGQSCLGVTINNTGYVFASYWAKGNITVYNSTYANILNITGFSVSNGIRGLVYNNYNNTLFVAGYTDGKMYVVNADTGAIIGYGQIGNGPYRTAIGTQANVVQHQVKFVIQSLFGIIKYSDATVTVYDENGVLQYSKQTDSTGQVAFYLQPTSKYTLWINSTSSGVNMTWSVVPYDSIYYVEVIPFITSWNPLGWLQGVNNSWTGYGSGDINKDIVMNYTTNTTVSPRSVTINYCDYTRSTEQLNFTLLRFWQTNGTYTVFNTTVLVPNSGTGYYQMVMEVPDSVADGQSYQLVLTSETNAYGTVSRMDTIHFPGVAYPLPGLPTAWYPYIAFGIIVLLGLMFTYLSSGLGLIIMAATGAMFMLMGWLVWSDAFMLLFQILAVFGVGYIFKQRRQRDGV